MSGITPAPPSGGTGVDEAAPDATASAIPKAPNPYDNSYPLDLNRDSSHAEVQNAVDTLLAELERLPGFKGNKAKNRNALKVLLVDLLDLHHFDASAYLGYSRDSAKYKIDRRYNSHCLSYAPLIRVVDGLEALSYVEGKIGFIDRRTGKSRQARMRATPKLSDFARRAGVTPHMLSRHSDEETIILRDKDGTPVPYTDTKEIRRKRSVVSAYNYFLRNTYVDVYLKGYKGAHPVRVNLNRNFNRRIFNNSSWKEGGRFYGGWWQTIPRDLRQRITIQGKATVEIDYSGMHIVILYAMEGIDYFGSTSSDPYEIPGFPNDDDHRALFKLILLTVLNSDSELQATRAIAEEVRFNPGSFPPGVDVKDAIKAFRAKHSPIEKHFFTGIGTKLQYYDSLVAERVIEHFTGPGSIGMPPLVVHDSFIVRSEMREDLEKVMQSAFQDVVRDIVSKKGVRISPKLKLKVWKEYGPISRPLRTYTGGDLKTLLDEYFSSDTYDPDQEHRRTVWNETGKYPPAVYEP